MANSHGWITGDISAPVSNYVYRIVRLPNDPVLIIAFNGALADLGIEHNWEQTTGDETPEVAAEIMRDVLVSMVDSGEQIPMIMPHYVRLQFATRTISNLSQVTLTPNTVWEWSSDEWRDLIMQDPPAIRLPWVGLYTLGWMLFIGTSSNLRAIRALMASAGLNNVVGNDQTIYNPQGFAIERLNAARQAFYNNLTGREMQLTVLTETSDAADVTLSATNSRLTIEYWGDIPYNTLD